jgi:glycosyltransferase involved in cell wall biosynthesis
MRIAIITENFLPKLDGVTRTLARLLQYLQENRHEALLLGPESGMEHYAGAEIVGTAGVPLPFYSELKFNFFRPLFIRRLSDFHPDIIHLVDPIFLGSVGLGAAKCMKIPVVSSFHTNISAYCGYFGFPQLTKPMWSYYRTLHSQCALTFCPSPSMANMLHEHGFQNLRIWSRGVDTALFRPERRRQELRDSWLAGRDRPQDIKVLLYVGRISWEKNLRLLTQAYHMMDHDHCHLVIVGNGPAFKEIQHEVAGLPVTFTGYLKGEQLATAYASADIFAFPSTSETFGQVVLEAMASGLPVAGVLSEGVCDLVEHERTGLLLDTHGLDEDEQATGHLTNLHRLVHNAPERHAMGQAALQEASLRSWSEAMDSLLSGYHEVLEARSPLIAA